MSMTKDQLKKLVLELPDDERAELVTELLEELENTPSEPEGEVEQAWAKEYDKRMTEVDSGQVKLIPGPQALENIFGLSHE